MIKLPETTRKKQFLVVDDYESMRTLISEHLQQLGVERILVANSGNEGLKIIKQNLNTDNQIDFILIDMVMEDGSGLDLVKSLRAVETFKSLPILMISSKSEIGLVIECVKAGVTHYIVKPWQLDDLARKISDSILKVKN